VDNHFADGASVFGGLAGGSVHGRCLLSFAGRGEHDVKGDLGLGISVRVNLELVARLRVKGGRQRGRSGVHIQNQNRLGGIARLLEDIEIRNIVP